MSLTLKHNGHKVRNTYRKERATRFRGISGAVYRGGKEKRAVKSWKRYAAGVKSFAALFCLLAIVLLFLTGVCFLSLWLYRAATTSEFFTTRHVDVAGNVRLSREMVLDFSGITIGSNSLAISIADVERRLRETPWVEEVSVKRLLPDRFIIKLKERMPSFWVHKDGVLYYANVEGGIIAPVESENFLSLPTLIIEEGAEEDIPYLARLLQDMQKGGLPVETGAVASVSLSSGRGVEIYLEDREMRLAIATDDWDGNLTRIGVTLGDLARRHELKDVREVRSFNGNVWVILNRPVH